MCPLMVWKYLIGQDKVDIILGNLWFICFDSKVNGIYEGGNETGLDVDHIFFNMQRICKDYIS